ncbi:MAG: isochorismatase family protein [Cryomorphaceae bacterium]|nr:isochorismatase family protein [Cryomorphaceae bacterium]
MNYFIASSSQQSTVPGPYSRSDQGIPFSVVFVGIVFFLLFSLVVAQSYRTLRLIRRIEKSDRDNSGTGSGQTSIPICSPSEQETLLQNDQAGDGDQLVDTAIDPGQTLLVIVDMQPDFSAAKSPDTVSFVESAVVQAVNEGWKVVVLEFDGYGKTHHSIMSLLSGYSEVEVCIKTVDDGSREVLGAVRRRHWSPKLVRVVGVNSHACVQDTTLGLARLRPDFEIEVLKKGCNRPGGNNWSDFSIAANVRLSDTEF